MLCAWKNSRGGCFWTPNLSHSTLSQKTYCLLAIMLFQLSGVTVIDLCTRTRAFFREQFRRRLLNKDEWQAKMRNVYSFCALSLNFELIYIRPLLSDHIPVETSDALTSTRGSDKKPLRHKKCIWTRQVQHPRRGTLPCHPWASGGELS